MILLHLREKLCTIFFFTSYFWIVSDVSQIWSKQVNHNVKPMKNQWDIENFQIFSFARFYCQGCLVRVYKLSDGFKYTETHFMIILFFCHFSADFDSESSWILGRDPDFPEICPTLRVDIFELNEDFFKILNVL